MTKKQLLEILAEIYAEDGPRGWQGQNCRVVPAKKYAAMDALDIERTWDFGRRHLMHKIAKALVNGQ